MCENNISTLGSPNIDSFHPLTIDRAASQRNNKPINTSSFDTDVLPTEILALIFSHLPPNFLMNCREVCKRWMYLVDKLKSKEQLWRKHCETDFQDVYADAFLNARLTWYNLYRSLTLWSKLSSATVEETEISPLTYHTQTIIGLVMLRDGNVGVHTDLNILYYDTMKLKRVNIDAITGHYLHYQENSLVIALLSGHNRSLNIICKQIDRPHLKNLATFADVRLYHLCDNKVYYVTLSNEIYVWDLTSDPLKDVLIANFSERIMCINYHGDALYVLTFKKNIFKVKDKTVSLVTPVYGDMLAILYRYKLLENIDWRVFHDWVFEMDSELNIFVSELNVTKVLVYGDIVFVGTRFGILQIYLVPYVGGVFDFFRCKPSKRWSFMERSENPNLYDYAILDIKVIETEQSHRVLVLMPKRIVVLDLLHKT